jgi:hypothetical protein
MESKRRGQSASESSSLCRDNELRHVRKMQRAQYRQQDQQQWRDAREPHLVGRTNVQCLQHSPAAKRSRRDQKSRDREENLHSRCHFIRARKQSLRNPVRVRHIWRKKSMLTWSSTRERWQSAQQIHPIRPFPTASRLQPYPRSCAIATTQTPRAVHEASFLSIRNSVQINNFPKIEGRELITYSSLPLNRSWRLGGNVVHHAVHALYLIYNSSGNIF